MKECVQKIFVFCFIWVLFVCSSAVGDVCRENQWSVDRVKKWYDKQEWIVGCNFIPSDAVNQLEMWQKETFSPRVIDRELGWAENLGFNTVRVFLNSLVWEADPKGYKERINQYLTIAHKHGIRTMFVIFDDCRNSTYKLGKQPAPKPGMHNAMWVQDPIAFRRNETSANLKFLEAYVKDILTTFKDDERVLIWDLYNEPGNRGHRMDSFPLLKRTFKWARDVNPSQPLTASVWALDLYEMSKFIVENSDVISYHCYSNRGGSQQWINFLRLHGRPLICSEWMARHLGSTFKGVMPILKRQRVGAISWGLVAGKTNTIFSWTDSHSDGKEPKVWFHDILRKDGTPFSQSEIDLIKKITQKE